MEVNIGIFGGTGFLKLFDDNSQALEIDTPYGKPSDLLTITEYDGKKIVFLPRHGSNNQLLPHEINYRANIWAMKSLGVKKIIAPCAAGSLKKEIKPGDFVICDDVVNNTHGSRIDTFYNSEDRIHVYMDNTYCPKLRNLISDVIESNNFACHKQGTVVVINGPRFATRAESKSYIKNGWDVINMTQYPECYLAKESDICYANITLITDYDIGVDGVSKFPLAKMKETFKNNCEKLRVVLLDLIKKITTEQEICNCANTSKFGRTK